MNSAVWFGQSVSTLSVRWAFFYSLCTTVTTEQIFETIGSCGGEHDLIPVATIWCVVVETPLPVVTVMRSQVARRHRERAAQPIPLHDPAAADV